MTGRPYLNAVQGGRGHIDAHQGVHLEREELGPGVGWVHSAPAAALHDVMLPLTTSVVVDGDPKGQGIALLQHLLDADVGLLGECHGEEVSQVHLRGADGAGAVEQRLFA